MNAKNFMCIIKGKSPGYFVEFEKRLKQKHTAERHVRYAAVCTKRNILYAI